VFAAISEAFPSASWDRTMTREAHELMSTVTLRCIVSDRLKVDPIYIKTIINNTDYTVVKSNRLEMGYDSERYQLWDRMEYHPESNVWIMELTIRGNFLLGNKVSFRQ